MYLYGIILSVCFSCSSILHLKYPWEAQSFANFVVWEAENWSG